MKTGDLERGASQLILKDLSGRAILKAQISHAILHHIELDGDDTSHFNSSTEGDLTITLGEMEIANTEFGAFDMDRKIHFATSR